jgi:catechol 2,3-dioxygenase-like lactoylglutathione lyase family enzyme
MSQMPFELEGLVEGLHHITLVTSNEEVNRMFYTEVLGLRRVKLTVNQDDVFHRHLFYANEKGMTGSAITFFEWPAFDHATPVTRNPELIVNFFSRLLGLKNWIKQTNPDQDDAAIIAIGNDDRSRFLRYIASPRAPVGYVGAGNIHHIAMAVENDRDQLRILRQLDASGINNSGIIDRFWFKSLYFRDPDGNLLEIATKGPGYTADEPLEKLGSRLVLAPWLEPRRVEIEEALNKLDEKNTHSWPPIYPQVSSQPESLLG